MKVLIAEFLWQHTEVLGTWLEFFSRRGADITIYYPQFSATPHNYITIWGKFYKFKLDIAGQICIGDYDVVLCNTTVPEVLRALAADWPQTRFLAVGHYRAQSIAKWLLEDKSAASRICEIPVNPFFESAGGRSATTSADLPTNLQVCQPRFILPVCRQLADVVADARLQMPAAKKILLIGNSFKSTPAHLFNTFTSALQSAGYTLSATLYGYNDISGYNFSHISVTRDIPAIDLYKSVEEARFILFLPADYHYFNQLSGTIPLSLTFSRPLITFKNVLEPYKIRSFYSIGDPALLQQLECVERYKEAQTHLEVRLNEFLAQNAEILEDCLRSLEIADN